METNQVLDKLLFNLIHLFDELNDSKNRQDVCQNTENLIDVFEGVIKSPQNIL